MEPISDWDRLVEDSRERMMRICWRILGNRHDAEEAVQETLMKAFTMSLQEPISNWPGLFSRIATTSSLQILRKRRRNISLEIEPVDSTQSSPLQSAVQAELKTKLRHAISLLPEREAAVFCLRYFENLSPREIASSLNIEYGAAVTALHRARRKLEEQFAKIENREDIR